MLISTFKRLHNLRFFTFITSASLCHRIKWVGRLLVVFACTTIIFGVQITVSAQTLEASITAKKEPTPQLHVSLVFPQATDVLSIRNTYAGIRGLGERITAVEAADAGGVAIRVEKVGAGEFRAARKASRVTYDVDVPLPGRFEDMSHVSWINQESGLLLPADFLPRPIVGFTTFSDVRISLQLPDGWGLSSNSGETAKQFLTNEPDKVVMFIGPHLRTVTTGVGSGNLRVTASGDWPFSESDALNTAAKILEEYYRVTGWKLKRDSYLMLAPFPGNVAEERWSAETRGNTVIMLMGRGGSGKQRLKRLAVLLSHELFHLWVPNSLALEGDYDWFFEGFTIYQALLTDVRLGLISFDSYLQTLGKVYRSYLASAGRDDLSLITASEQRWTTSSSLVYDKGMLVAFLYDLMLRSTSDCRTSLSDIYGDIFRLPLTGQPNANETIIRLLSSRPGTEAFVRGAVAGTGSLDLEKLISPYGLQVQMNAARPSLKVSDHLTEAQRKTLRCLGY